MLSAKGIFDLKLSSETAEFYETWFEARSQRFFCVFRADQKTKMW